ncbi:MAG: tetratricopeptide repeat protein [Chlamydiales bacterium]
MTTADLSSQEKVKLFDATLPHEKAKELISGAAQKFHAITSTTQRFHLTFFALAFGELSAFIVLSYFSKSLLIAICLAGLCLSAFSYFLLRFYLEAKKPQQMAEIVTSYVASCREAGGEKTSTLSLAQMLHYLADSLDIPQNLSAFSFLQTVMQKLRVWMHWKEVLEMKELLLHEAIFYHVEMVKIEPMDLQIHGSLAHAYLSLAKLYLPSDAWPWIPAEYASRSMEEKYEENMESAIQEFKILDFLAPNDAWVHAQLAHIYEEMGDVEKEVQEYEMLLQISPDDHELHYRLGVLYFQRNETAKALLLYQKLKESSSPRAQELISYYY